MEAVPIKLKQRVKSNPVTNAPANPAKIGSLKPLEIFFEFKIDMHIIIKQKKMKTPIAKFKKNKK